MNQLQLLRDASVPWTLHHRAAYLVSMEVESGDTRTSGAGS
ncbi:hypothetical protein [Salibacterium halotolerans]|nr:hypothetical protein [Salibacterium halotolerans]